MRRSIQYYLKQELNATKIVRIKCIIKELITFIGISGHLVSNRQSELVYARVTCWQAWYRITIKDNMGIYSISQYGFCLAASYKLYHFCQCNGSSSSSCNKNESVLAICYDFICYKSLSPLVYTVEYRLLCILFLPSGPYPRVLRCLRSVFWALIKKEMD